MKKMWGTRVLAMLLVLALTAGLVPAALAANSEAAVAFKQVPNDTLDTLIRPDVAVGEIEDAEMGEDTAAYQAHDLVRVSIILEDTSTLEAYSDAAAEGTLAEDAVKIFFERFGLCCVLPRSTPAQAGQHCSENLVHDPRTGGSGCCLESDVGRQPDLCQCGIRQDRAD